MISGIARGSVDRSVTVPAVFLVCTFKMSQVHVRPSAICEKPGKKPWNAVAWPAMNKSYVDDAAEGFLMAAERYDGADPVNLGAGFEISMRDLAEKIRSKVGYDGEVEWDRSKPNGQPRRMLDVSRARERFGFEAQTSLDEGLDRTIAWYRQHAGG